MTTVLLEDNTCQFLNLDSDTPYFVVAGAVSKGQRKQKILSGLREACSDRKDAVLMQDIHGYYIVLIPDNGAEDIVATCEVLKDKFIGCVGAGITLAIGGVAQTLPELYEAYKKACEAMEEKYFMGKNIIISYESITRNVANENQVVDALLYQEQLLQAIRGSGEKDVAALCEIWFQALRRCSRKMVESALLQLMGNLAGELIEAETSLTELFGEKGNSLEELICFETIFEAEEEMKRILLCIFDYLGEKNQKRSRKLAKKAAQYIDEHYMEKITIDAVANAVYLSAGYLMTIFKREMGISIVSYLTTKRMNMAKKLLQESDTRIYEVAERVGYANATFFSTAFRNSVGMSPKQYRKQCKGGEQWQC